MPDLFSSAARSLLTLALHASSTASSWTHSGAGGSQTSSSLQCPFSATRQCRAPTTPSPFSLPRSTPSAAAALAALPLGVKPPHAVRPLRASSRRRQRASCHTEPRPRPPPPGALVAPPLGAAPVAALRTCRCLRAMPTRPRRAPLRLGAEPILPHPVYLGEVGVGGRRGRGQEGVGRVQGVRREEGGGRSRSRSCRAVGCGWEIRRWWSSLGSPFSCVKRSRRARRWRMRGGRTVTEARGARRPGGTIRAERGTRRQP